MRRRWLGQRSRRLVAQRLATWATLDMLDLAEVKVVRPLLVPLLPQAMCRTKLAGVRSSVVAGDRFGLCLRCSALNLAADIGSKLLVVQCIEPEPDVPPQAKLICGRGRGGG